MDGGTGAELLSPGEAEWPPELRLPPPPPPLPGRPGPALRAPPAPTPAQHLPPPQLLQPKKEPSPPRHAEGFDDQQFLGSIMGAAAQHPPQQQQQQPAAAEAPVKRKRGRPPKNRNGAAAAVAAPVKPVKKKDEEVVCFICFDGGNLVVCDRRGCPKVYHPACIKRDESFFRLRGKWDCGWHICSSCEKAVHYMCYTCTYSVCKGCIKQGKFFGVRGNKGFCDTCYGTILLIESKDDSAKAIVDFDDINSWEYLFKLYWLDLKAKHLLTLEELNRAKSHWTVPTTVRRRVKDESSDESYDANSDQDASFDISSRKRKQNDSSGNRERKRQRDSGITARKCEISIKGAESLPNRSPSEGMALPGDTKWASSELMEFIGHMRNGDTSYISQYDVQVLLLEYIKQNNLRDPRKKSQIICDARLSILFGKPRVAHFEMLKILEMHFLVKENPTVNVDSQRAIDPNSAQVDNGGYNELAAKSGSDKRRKVHKKIERELIANPEDYAAIDMHNINLIYLRRSLMENLIDDNASFSDKIAGAFVRIRISGLGQKQDMYRLVKVLGTHKVAERYSVGKKTTNYALEISNLDKKEVITMDTISNQDFTEEECKRLRKSMKFGLVTRLKVRDIHEKAKVFQPLQVNDWLENEKQRLSHLCDRASETGRRKELRECVEKLQLLTTPEERARRINEIAEVHVDPRMTPNYESTGEQDYKKAADWTINRSGSDLLFPRKKGTESKSVENHTQKFLDASGHTSSVPIEDMTNRSGAGINLNNTAVEAASLSSSEVLLSDTEPEKVWHYKDRVGNVQGPFTLSQLSNWKSYFPPTLRIWLTFESEENSLLLTEVLKQQKDFVQPSAAMTSDKSIWAGTGQGKINSSLVANNSASPIGYNVAYSSALPSESTEFSNLTKEGSKLLCGTLPSRSLKDAHTLHGQVQHHVNYSCTISSSAGSCGPAVSHDEGVRRERVIEWNNRQDNGDMWSPTILPMSHSCKSTVEPHPDVGTMKDQMQNDSKSNPLARSVENLESKMESGSPEVSVLTPQQSERDPTTSLRVVNPSEFETVCKKDVSAWSSATNASTHDDLQLSIALAKPESCSPTNPIEDRDSSSASGVSSHSGVPVCLPHPVPSVSTSNSRLTGAATNENKACHPIASSELFNQHSEPKSDPVFSANTLDLECEYPSPTPKLLRKETSLNQSGSTSVAPKDSETSGTSAGKIGSLQSLKETSCPEQNCEKYSILGAEPLENSVPAPTEEEQPQCSSPIALSPWGEPGYYQGEAVDSALWGVQDDHNNDIWSMPSPTPALQPSSGLGADAKDTSCMVEELVVVRGDNAFVEELPKQVEKNMEQGNSSVPAGSGVLELGKPKPNAESGPFLDGSTKATGWQLSGSSQEGSAKATGWQPSGSFQEGSGKTSGWKVPGLSLEGITKASAWQPSDSSLEGGAKGCQPSEGGIKASGWQPSDSSLAGGAKASSWKLSGSTPDGSRKTSCWQPSDSATERSAKSSGWQRSSRSPEGRRNSSACQRSSTSPEKSRKASGWQQSDSFTQGNAKVSGWQPSGSSTEGGAKVDGWQRTSSSPEGSRKGSGWHSSFRESSKVHSTSCASENRKSSFSHQTSKHTSEAPKRHGNSDKNTAGWGEAQAPKRLGDSDKNTVGWGEAQTPKRQRNSDKDNAGWGEALGNIEAPKRQGSSDRNTPGWGEALVNNRSWHPSSGNASRGSQGSHHHDRRSHGSDSWRGSSNHSRRSDHRQDHGGGGSSRPSSRGQSQRGACKYYDNGKCWKGTSCQYLHR